MNTPHPTDRPRSRPCEAGRVRSGDGSARWSARCAAGPRRRGARRRRCGWLWSIAVGWWTARPAEALARARLAPAPPPVRTGRRVVRAGPAGPGVEGPAARGRDLVRWAVEAAAAHGAARAASAATAPSACAPSSPTGWPWRRCRCSPSGAPGGCSSCWPSAGSPATCPASSSPRYNRARVDALQLRRRSARAGVEGEALPRPSCSTAPDSLATASSHGGRHRGAHRERGRRDPRAASPGGRTRWRSRAGGRRATARAGPTGRAWRRRPRRRSRRSSEVGPTPPPARPGPSASTAPRTSRGRAPAMSSAT